MTPKEKAFELVYKYYKITKEFEFIKGEGLVPYYGSAKQCALIAVDEILESSPLEPNDSPEWLQPEDWFPDANIYAEKYWKEVKTEIEKL
jgi:hypothetical protein